MSNPQSIRVSNRMRLALDRVRPLMAQWAEGVRYPRHDGR